MADVLDPMVAFAFALEFEGVTLAMFKSVSGMETTVEVTEVRQVGSDGKTNVTKVPGQVKYADVTFTRGFSKDDELDAWYKAVLEKGTAGNLKTASVILFDHAGAEKIRWNMEKCWPSVLKTNAFEASSSEVVIEEMTFVVNRVERVVS
ncbi:MAG: hypothetical protein JWM47_1401 [Acidimicrobiales bacterium]|nr:hypothetical protein [Acidimicrobiales bacterium]